MDTGKKLYKCGPFKYLLPETSCVFCDHCTDIYWDGLNGIYAMTCDIEAYSKCDNAGYGCSEFKNTEVEE